MARDPILALARTALGFRRLRPGQREAVQALLENETCWPCCPPGRASRASISWPPCGSPEPTVVVSPLVALQRDQVEAIARTVLERKLLRAR
jgi:ATP-dependent DNA helicase RecQ